MSAPAHPTITEAAFISLRDYVNQRFDDDQRAREVADHEREKAATAVRDGMQRADLEREKAATAVRDGVQRALDSAEKLEVERIAAVRKEMELNFDNSREAIRKAEEAQEKRFDSVNEFRQTLTDQAQTFIPRKEAEQATKVNTEKIDALQQRMDRNEGRSTGLNAGWGYLVGGLGLLIAIATLIISTWVGSPRPAATNPKDVVPAVLAVPAPK